MKTLNFNKLSKSMSLKEKANLLFADFNLQCDTRGKERLLTPEEEKSIYEDCRSKHQFPQMDQLHSLFNLIRRSVVDLGIRTLLLDSQMSKLHIIILGIFLSQEKKPNGPSYFPWFEPLDSDEETCEPNVSFQQKIRACLLAYKSLRKGLYIVQLLEEKGKGVQFLNDALRKMVNDAAREAANFEEMDGFLGMINIYKKAQELEVMRSSGFTVPEFEEFLLNPQKTLELTEEERAECEETILYGLNN